MFGFVNKNQGKKESNELFQKWIHFREKKDTVINILYIADPVPVPYN